MEGGNKRGKPIRKKSRGRDGEEPYGGTTRAISQLRELSGVVGGGEGPNGSNTSDRGKTKGRGVGIWETCQEEKKKVHKSKHRTQKKKDLAERIKHEPHELRSSKKKKEKECRKLGGGGAKRIGRKRSGTRDGAG